MIALTLHGPKTRNKSIAGLVGGHWTTPDKVVLLMTHLSALLLGPSCQLRTSLANNTQMECTGIILAQPKASLVSASFCHSCPDPMSLLHQFKLHQKWPQSPVLAMLMTKI
jgi:hypothetical protein